MPVLRVVTGDGIIFDHPCTGEKITIGRTRNCDLPLKDRTVSRYHAEIIKTNDGYQIQDLASFNGTRINGKLIQTAPLHGDDKLQIGLTRLTFLEDIPHGTHHLDSLLLTTEGEFETGEQRIVQSSPRKNSEKTADLLTSLAIGNTRKGTEKTPSITRQASFSDLARMNKVLFVLYEISRQLNQIADFDQLLRKIMDLIFMVIDADYGFLVLLGGRDEKELIPVVVKQQENLHRETGELKASKTLIRKVIQDKVDLLTSNAMADSRLNGAKSLYLQKIKSAMCVPLWRKEKVIGVIELGTSRLENHFDQNDLELLKAIGSHMAMIIEQAALNEQIREEERS